MTDFILNCKQIVKFFNLNLLIGGKLCTVCPKSLVSFYIIHILKELDKTYLTFGKGWVV